MQESGSAATQAGTRIARQRPFTAPPFPAASVPSRLAIAVIDLYLLCCARATGADENNVHARELQWNKVKNGAIMWFFSPPQRFDTVITVHLEEKLQLQILSYPSICGAHSVPGVIL